MNETELERLVVRLTGDSDSYDRMLGRAEEGNKRLVASLKQIESAQKDLKRQIDDTTTSMGRMEAQAQRMSMTFGQMAQSIKRDLVTATGAYFEANTMFASQRRFAEQVRAYTTPGNYAGAVSLGAEGFMAGLASMRRDRSTYHMGTMFAVSDYKYDRVTPQEARFEAYQKSLKPHYEAIARDEREHKLSLEREDRDNIFNREDQMRATQAALRRASDRESRLRRSVESPTGTGSRARVEEMERRWLDRAMAELTYRVAGGVAGVGSGLLFGFDKNPFEREIDRRREVLDKKRTELLGEAEPARRGLVREVERRRRGYEESDRDTLRSLRRKVSRFDVHGRPMTAREEMEADLDERGVRGEGRTAIGMTLDRGEEQQFGESIRGIRASRAEIGMKPRRVRDKRAIDRMLMEGRSEEDVKLYQREITGHDIEEDLSDRNTKVTDLVKALNDQAKAYRNNKDAIAPYLADLRALKVEEGDIMKIRKQAEETQRAGLAMAVHERYMPKQQKIAEYKAKLDAAVKMERMKPEEAQLALADFTRSLNTGGGGRAPMTGAVDVVEAGSIEAYDRLMAFREGAFGGGGGARGGIASATKKQREREMRNRRRAMNEDAYLVRLGKRSGITARREEKYREALFGGTLKDKLGGGLIDPTNEELVNEAERLAREEMDARVALNDIGGNTIVNVDSPERSKWFEKREAGLDFAERHLTDKEKREAWDIGGAGTEKIPGMEFQDIFRDRINTQSGGKSKVEEFLERIAKAVEEEEKETVKLEVSGIK